MTDLIAAHLRHIRAAGLARTTIVDRAELLRRVDQDLPFGLAEATVEELADWLAREGWSAQTRATYYGHLRGFFRWGTAGPDPILADDPSAGLTRPAVPQGVPKPVTDEELAAALDRSGPIWRRCILLAAYAGARCCEIATLDRSSVNPVTVTLTGKGGKSRVVPTHPAVWAAVGNLPPGPVAITTRGEPATAAYVSSAGYQHLARIGLPGVSMHRFRHWYATTLLNAGANLRVVQELLGHSSPNTTARYTLVTDEQRRIAVAALPTVTPASR